MQMNSKHVWIPGNLNPQWKIKEKDQGYYNVLLTRRLFNNLAPTRPITREWVKCFREKDYYKYFVNCNQEQKIGYLQSMNVDESELIHDPSKVNSVSFTNTNAPQPGAKTALTQKERLQAKAKELGVKGWDKMSVPKLRNAINEVK